MAIKAQVVTDSTAFMRLLCLRKTAAASLKIKIINHNI